MKRTLLLLPLAAALLAGCTSTYVSSQELAAQKEIYDRETKTIVDGGGGKRVDTHLASITGADLDAEGYVTVLAWKGGQAAMNYYAAPGNTDTLDSKYLTWVTKASQMESMVAKLKLHQKKKQALALRLEQLLGLPPAGDTTRMFVEMRILPTDLFRPCRDPEVNDCECALDFPVGAYSPTNKDYMPVYEGTIVSTQGFPWTRLGYTLDWDAQNPTHFGMSEYVIRQGAIVKIVSKTGTEAWVDQK